MHFPDRAPSHPVRRINSPAVLFLLLFLMAAAVQAQSSLFNIPTTDVAGERQGYIEADFDTNFASYRNEGWRSYGFMGIYGINKKTEVGINAYAVRTIDGFEPVELQPNLKYRVYNNETYGVAVSTGAIAYIPVSKQLKNNSVGSVYAVASKQFKGDWSPRFTGGAYRMIGSKEGDGSKHGFLLGVEQPVFSGVTFIADWNSGKNRLGYSAAGVGISLTNRSYLSSAYYFGNEGRRNNFFGIYYGYSF